MSCKKMFIDPWLEHLNTIRNAKSEMWQICELKKWLKINWRSYIPHVICVVHSQSVCYIIADRTRLIQSFSSGLLLPGEIDTRGITSNQALITFSTLIAVSQDVISPCDIRLFGFGWLLNRNWPLFSQRSIIIIPQRHISSSATVRSRTVCFN